ncbi:MAG TPA: LytTR family DNA-binding domain-containing protein [Stellaceae bacterium]|nr:LytTR family DNA-binding domain-containing protein [Stellaceae bacterium]
MSSGRKFAECGRAQLAHRELGSALREMSLLAYPYRRILILILLGLVFGWLGPYGTYTSIGLPERLGYWTLAMLLIGFPAGFIVRALRQTPPSASWPAPIQGAVSALIIGVPATFIGVALQTIFIAPPPASLAGLAAIYGSVTVLSAVIAIPWILLGGHDAPAAGTADAAPEPPRSSEQPVPTPEGRDAETAPFLRRVPAKLGRELLCVATEDHYLRVTTAAGSDLILFRMSDALAELKPLAGQQVHRSYWVAERAVAAAESDGQRTFLILSNGARVPVSQTYLPALRQAGWLEKRLDKKSGAVGAALGEELG